MQHVVPKKLLQASRGRRCTNILVRTSWLGGLKPFWQFWQRPRGVFLPSMAGGCTGANGGDIYSALDRREEWPALAEPKRGY